MAAKSCKCFDFARTKSLCMIVSGIILGMSFFLSAPDHFVCFRYFLGTSLLFFLHQIILTLYQVGLLVAEADCFDWSILFSAVSFVFTRHRQCFVFTRPSVLFLPDTDSVLFLPDTIRVLLLSDTVFCFYQT